MKGFKLGFSSWVEEYPKIKRALWKSSSQVSQLLSPLYEKKMYIKMTNWKMIESIKQEGKRIGRGFKV